MRSILAIAAALLLVSAATAIKAEAVSDANLSTMGLGNMQTMSAEEGLAVRGKGTYAGVWGSSSARFGNQSSSNNYSAGSSWLGKPSGATGSSFSFTGKVQLFGRFGR